MDSAEDDEGNKMRNGPLDNLRMFDTHQVFPAHDAGFAGIEKAAASASEMTDKYGEAREEPVQILEYLIGRASVSAGKL